MAVVKGLALTDFKGSVGRLTLRKTSYGNVASQKVTEVKNPRSQSQQIQRMILTTVSKAYGNMKEIVDHSFEGVPSGALSMNRFAALNAELLRGDVKANTLLFSSMGKESGIAPNAYVISQGSLGKVAPVGVNQNVIEYSHSFATNASSMTIDQFLSVFGAKRGDQLTFCAIVGRPSYSDYADSNGFSFRYDRVTIKADVEGDARAFANIDAGVGLLNPDVVDLTKTPNWPNVRTFYKFSVTDADYPDLGSLFVTFAYPAMSALPLAKIQGANVIVSRWSSTKWLRSNSALYIESSNEFWENEALAYKFDNALKTYKPSDEMYLNEAVQG